MNNSKISKILGVGLAISVLTTLLTVAVPVSAADDLSWGSESGPSSLSTSNVLASGSDVLDVAVSADGNTVFAVSASQIYKSTNGGGTWAQQGANALGTVTTANMSAPALVAVAPDDANTVLVTGTGNVSGTVGPVAVISTDGGTTYSAIAGFNLTGISAVAISPLVSGVRNVALAGTTGAAGDVQYLNLGAVVSSWTSMTGGTGWVAYAGFASDLNVDAIAFSPNFASDKVLVAVNNDATGANATLQIASFSSKKWNATAGFTGYPANIAASGAITSASIALAPTYLGADETLRVAFVGLNSAANGGLYRMNNATATVNLMSTATNIASVAYNGTNLVAGSAADNNVYYSANPTASAASVTVSNTTVYQRPGGTNMVQVAWAGANVVAGTSGTNSAFAVSKDNGATFNDVSLIDTKYEVISDFAISPDAATLYTVSSANATPTLLNVFRKTTAWERVLTLTVADVNNWQIVVAPENPAAVYLFNTASADMYFSDDSGEKKWLLRAGIENPVDIAVESAQVVYTITAAGKVYKSTNAGFTWDAGTASGLTSANTIVSVKKDQLLAGGGGKIAWSTDGSASATTWKTATATGSGAVQVTADKLDTGGFVYAASTSDTGKDVVRFAAGSTTSTDIFSGTLNGVVTGIGLRDGVLNIIGTNSTTNVSGLLRTLIPTKAVSTTTWSEVDGNTSSTITGLWLSRAPKNIALTTDGKVWSLNNPPSAVGAANALFSVKDTVYKTAPAPTAPADQAIPQTNPVSGNAQDVAFSWPRLSLSTSYKLELSLDKDFTQIVSTATITPTPATTDPVVALVGPTGANAVLNFAPDTTYYWRVRAIQPLESPNSVTRSFAFSTLTPFVLNEPAVGASDVPIKPILSWTSYKGALWYEVTLSEDPSFAIPEWSHNVYNLFYGVEEPLKYSTTYYWRVRGVTAEPFVQGTKVITPAGPWQTGAFTTVAEPVTPPTQQIIVEKQAPPQVIQLPPVEKEVLVPQPIPSWMLLTIIVIGAILVIALVVLIVRTRRVA